MATEVRWTRTARSELLEIYKFVARENPAAADNILARIEKLVGLLQYFPRIGVPRHEPGRAIRMLVERPYLVFYRAVPDVDEEAVQFVEVVRVIDGRRDLKNLI